MGYTHYWSNHEIPPNKWEIILSVARMAITELPHATPIVRTAGNHYSNEPLIIGNNLGEHSEPILNGDRIELNGIGYMSHESFVFKRNGGNDLCKTAAKPYDVVVCVILAYASGLGLVDVRSDGTFADWEPALRWLSDKLGVEVPSPLTCQAA